jgi:hypothetical protein
MLHFWGFCAGGRPVPRGLLRSLCRRRRRAHPPARRPSRVQCPVWLPRSPATGPGGVLVCVGAAAAGVLGGAWYRFVVASRRTSSGHAVHVCATGAVATCAPRAPVCVGPSWPGGLVLRVALGRCGENGRICSIAGGGAAATGRWGGANGLLPPLAAICSDVMACLDTMF